ncbi:uncharacterized protein L969DRAFT_86609 [Mixia osmundae IAM 14324]|uniref:Nudix hydrolase domain-containing protein n=1 Tax=Mixia osmundae (strain CBS 9802 / IAM 14324 / JCM 22182 / KY 12970) TaxID=764103 RepID=G7E9Q8_MIXOS|nr:uncharacterized protein L969DRAFT_86609 [Mixia osmundae IAM 14324]KEI40008.1 hypothetical protein L969DRAFT_86609 [Mixia osmundae IAM 14324]GAA99377.1 hypothetical protein E5Q_06073 [Mixia osmundae IAM 14324]
MSSTVLVQRLHTALRRIHETEAKLIASSESAQTASHGTPRTSRSASQSELGPIPGSSTGIDTPARDLPVPIQSSTRSRQASVAIVLRIRPANDILSQGLSSTPSASSSASDAATSPQDDRAGISRSGNSSSSLIRIEDHTRPLTSATLESEASTRQASANDEMLQRLDAFFAQEWVKTGTPEILYIKRASRASDKWSGHVAFPGGRREPDDEGALYTALRESWEEVGIDLAEREVLSVGQLDDREITTSLGKRLLMILSPFVFLHTSPDRPVPDLQPSEVASAHWIPLSLLHLPQVRWSDVKIDVSKRMAPRSTLIRWALKGLVGNMYFRCILLPNDPVAIGQISPDDELGARRPELRLWGLTLGMTLDVISHMTDRPIEALETSPATYPLNPALPSVSQSNAGRKSSQIAPPVSSIFPRFTFWDINFWIYVLGWRYRRLVDQWHAREALSGAADRRTNWAGLALGSYYSALRKALIVAILIRATVVTSLTSAGAYWLVKRWRARQKMIAL